MKKIPLDISALIDAKAWNPDAVNKLIEVFKPRIKTLINSFYYRTSDLRDDCVQSAYICLLNCCRKYDHKVSRNFSGFVIVSMRNTILNYLKQDAAQTRNICISSSSFSDFDLMESLELKYNLEEDVLEHIYLEKLNSDMENGYYNTRDVKLFKAICCSDFNLKTYAKSNDILISTLYKNIIRLKAKIKIRLNSSNCGNGTKFEAHKVVYIKSEPTYIKE